MESHADVMILDMYLTMIEYEKTNDTVEYGLPIG